MNHAKVSICSGGALYRTQKNSRSGTKFQYMNADCRFECHWRRKEFGSKFEFYENNEFLALAWCDMVNVCVCYMSKFGFRCVLRIIYPPRVCEQKSERWNGWRWIHYSSTAAFCGIIIEAVTKVCLFSVILERALTRHHAIHRLSYKIITQLNMSLMHNDFLAFFLKHAKIRFITLVTCHISSSLPARTFFEAAGRLNCMLIVFISDYVI